jgi:heat shock protein HtpX
MAMNFWEAQKKARSNTKIYLGLFVLLTLGMSALVEITMRVLDPADYSPDIPILGLIFLGVTFAVAAFQYSMMAKYGGRYVAESVGGRQISPATIHPQEKQLLNIVEETALASNLPVPPVYILPAKEINAFAAGLNPGNAAVAITEGALQKLNRDEVQGVIAHEFGHIYNGDMVIGMRLAAMVMGFFFVLYLAFRIISFSRISRQRDSKRGGNPVLLAALVLMGAGAITWLFGSILKASVSREREYLADACSVQFTRNPEGIASALRKIGKDATSDMPKEGMAFSHMYLDNHKGISALFATHPPLQKRIEAILGGRYDFKSLP